MDTRRLDGLYRKLTPDERLAAAFAAVLRNDTREETRLIESTPRGGAPAGTYVARAAIWTEFATATAVELLGLGVEIMGVLWEASRSADSAHPPRLSADVAERLLAVLTYRFRCVLCGWLIFAERRGMDGEGLLGPKFAGSEILGRLRSFVEGIAPQTPEELRDHLVRVHCEAPAKIMTPADVAGWWEEAFREELAAWMS